MSEKECWGVWSWEVLCVDLDKLPFFGYCVNSHPQFGFHMSRHRTRGFSLIELMLTMTIAIFITVAVYWGYSVMRDDQRVQETYSLVDLLVSDAVMASSSSSDFQVRDAAGNPAPIDNAAILAIRSNESEYPGGTSFDGDIIYHPFDGTVELSTNSTDGGATQDLFRVDVNNVPTKACLRLLSKFAGGMYDMYVNNNLVGVGPEATEGAAGRNELRVDQAAPLCNEDSRVQVSFRKLKDINFSEMRVKPLGNVLTAQEDANIRPSYERYQDAMDDREAAQLAIP